MFTCEAAVFGTEHDANIKDCVRNARTVADFLEKPTVLEKVNEIVKVLDVDKEKAMNSKVAAGASGDATSSSSATGPAPSATSSTADDSRPEEFIKWDNWVGTAKRLVRSIVRVVVEPASQGALKALLNASALAPLRFVRRASVAS